MMLHRWDLCGFWGASSNCRSCMTQKNCFDFDFDFWYWKSARKLLGWVFSSILASNKMHTRKLGHYRYIWNKRIISSRTQQFYLSYLFLKNKKTFSDVCMMTMMLDYILSIMHTFSSYSFQWVDRSQEILLWFCKLVLKNIYIYTSIRPYEKLFN